MRSVNFDKKQPMYLWEFVHNYTSKKTQEYSEKSVGRRG